MKKEHTTIDLDKSVRTKLNELKYKLGMKSQNNTVLFLIQFYEMQIKKGGKK